MQKEIAPPWGLVILLQSVLTYTYKVLYTLRMELQGDTSKFWQKFFKVLPSRFEMVIYIFSQFLGSCSFLSCQQEIYDKALVFCSLSAAECRKITPNTAGHGFAVFEVGYTVKLTGYCPPVQVLVRRRRRFQAVPLSGLPKRPGWRPRFPPESSSAPPRRSFAPLAPLS